MEIIKNEKNKNILVRAALIFLFYLCLALFMGVSAAAAQTDSLTLSITPPLVKNNVSPGEVWQSAIKVVNNNSAAIDIYVRAVDFTSGEESGTVRFLTTPAGSSSDNPYLLSQWLTILPGPYKVPPYGSQEIPFRVEVPETAGPGGHYAAILAGTKPPVESLSGSGIKISSLLASLLLLTIKGEVVEQGQIREFSADKTVYQEPSVTFRVRFANTGNVHIQPRGEIRVIDMFGEEKGRIEINHSTEFGNVLPASIRAWQFAWQAKKSLLNMGRYRAELVLSYGEEAKETVSQTLYFWVIYFKPLLIAAGSLLLLAIIFIWLIRRYIRRAVASTQAPAGVYIPGPGGTKQRLAVIPNQRQGGGETMVSDIRIRRKESAPEKGGKRLAVYLIIAVAGLAALILAVFSYSYFSGSETAFPGPTVNGDKAAGQAVDPPVAPEVIIINNETGEEIATTGDSTATSSHFQAAENDSPVLTPDRSAQASGTAEKETPVLAIRVLNGSGITGAAGQAAKRIEAAGYKVQGTGNADRFDYPSTVIRYLSERAREAEAISELFLVPVELVPLNDLTADIVVIVGKNY